MEASKGLMKNLSACQERDDMGYPWLIMALLVVALPVAYVWYLNIGGIVAAIKRRRKG